MAALLLVPSGDDPSRVLPFNLLDYQALLEETGRIVRDDQRGFIDGARPCLLARLGVAPDEWLKTVITLQVRYELAIGAPERLHALAVAWATK